LCRGGFQICPQPAIDIYAFLDDLKELTEVTRPAATTEELIQYVDEFTVSNCDSSDFYDYSD
jgi:hypothetical protein